MAIITWKISHLCIFNVIMLNAIVNAHVVELAPLCGTFNGSPPPKDADKIYFKDGSQGIQTIEINGTIYACYPDGSMVDTTSSESSELIDDHELHSRIQNGNNSAMVFTCFSLIYALSLSPPILIILKIVFSIPNFTDDNKSYTRPAPPYPTSRSFLANVGQCAQQNETFCTNDDNYPIDYIQKLLRKHLHKFADVFGTDMIVNDLATRIGNNDGEEFYLCDTQEKVIYPTSGKRQDGTDLYILNTPQHRQGVRVSMCYNKGQPCKMSDSFPNQFRTECKQQFVYRELLSLSPEGVPMKEKFEFPACCSCAVYRV